MTNEKNSNNETKDAGVSLAVIAVAAIGASVILAIACIYMIVSKIKKTTVTSSSQ